MTEKENKEVVKFMIDSTVWGETTKKELKTLVDISKNEMEFLISAQAYISTHDLTK